MKYWVSQFKEPLDSFTSKQLVNVVREKCKSGTEHIKDSGGRFSAVTRWIESEMKRK